MADSKVPAQKRGPLRAGASRTVSESIRDTERKILERERAAILARREAIGGEGPGSSDAAPSNDADVPPGGPIGLALSGGGIRSATFCLGVLQALAGGNLLKYFDYLSTVSGGGYIGASLSWFCHHGSKPGDMLGKDDFPYGTADPSAPREGTAHGAATDPTCIPALAYLRGRGNYLTPGGEQTLTSGIAVVLRGILLNLLVWLPITAWIMAVLIWAPVLLGAWIDGTSHPNAGLQCGATYKQLNDCTVVPVAFYVLLGLAVVMAMVFLVACVVYSLATFSVEKDQQNYRRRRFFEAWLRWPLRLGAFFLVLGLIPAFDVQAVKWLSGSGGAISVLLGALSGFASYARSQRGLGGQLTTRILAGGGAILFILGGLVLAYALALRVGPWELAGSGAVLRGFVGTLWILALAVAVGTGIFANVNYLSLHRFYRDRLMEAFMPDFVADKGCCANSGVSGKANKFTLKEIWKAEVREQEWSAGHATGPYHLINTNLVLVDSEDRTYRSRGGDSFLLSPFYCGSAATDWGETAETAFEKMTLATAMAISGAAANPNTGVAGRAVTRSELVSVLMALLNLRLGSWVPRPERPPGSFRLPPINHFVAARHELGHKGYREDRDRLQLSDGGHFDNLGLYELIRRKCRLIVACDAGADPDYQFSDLQTAMRRCAEDFNATIDFPEPGVTAGSRDQLHKLIPTENAGYPKNAKVAATGHIVGTIRYDDGSSGKLVYIKTTMVRGLSVMTRGYKGANPAFPDQSTADQFFDEDQFEAYRELGYALATAMLNDWDVALAETIDQIRRQPYPSAAPRDNP